MLLPCAQMRPVAVKKLDDLLAAYEPKELLVQDIPKGRQVLVHKNGEKIEFYSRIGSKLSRHVKVIKGDFLSVEDNFVVIGSLTKEKTVFLFDMLELNDKEVIDLPTSERLACLQKTFSNNFDKIVIVQPQEFKMLYSDGKLSIDTAFIKPKKSKFLINRSSRDEPVGEWYRYSNKDNVRDVIITSFYYGNNMTDGSRDVLFKCYQMKNRRQVYVGKVRILSNSIRRKCMNLLANGKRIVASVEIERDKRNPNRYKRLVFNNLKSDKPFSSVVCENDVYFEPIVIFDVRSKKKNVLIKSHEGTDTLKN